MSLWKDTRRSIRRGAPASVAALVLMLLSPRVCLAFEGREHRAVSRVALRLACLSAGMGEACTPYESLTRESTVGQLGDCDAGLGNWQPTFDDFVAWVDFIDDPEKLLHLDPGSAAVASSPASADALDRDFLCRLPNRPTAKLHAAHNNSGHFQEHLLHSIRVWHQSAIDEARAATSVPEHAGARRSLYAALLKAAIASHFLEDFFAPGHIAAPREAYPDYPANTLHDRHNSRGRVFTVSPEAERRFAELAQVLESRAPALRDSVEDSLFRELGLSEVEVQRFIHHDLLAGSRVLLRGDGDLLQPSSFGVERGRLPEPASRDAWDVDSVDRGCGDSRCERESRIQRALVALTVADAIRDVLVAGGLAGELRDVEPYAGTWRQMRDAFPEARRFPRQVYLASASTRTGEYFQEGPTRMRYGFMGLLEVGMSSFLEGSEEGGRGTLGAEWLPGLAPPGHRVGDRYVPKFVQYAIALGGAYRFEEGLRGPELTFREYVILPRLDMHFSVGARLTRFEIEGDRTTRLIPEVRFGKSYGFLGLFVGLNRDFQLRGAGNLEQVWGLQGGVQFALPWWRIARNVSSILAPASGAGRS